MSRPREIALKVAVEQGLRTPREIARQFLDAAVEQGIVARYVIRDAAGRATVYWKADGMKSFPKNVLEVIAALEAHGFKRPA